VKAQPPNDPGEGNDMLIIGRRRDDQAKGGQLGDPAAAQGRHHEAAAPLFDQQQRLQPVDVVGAEAVEIGDAVGDAP
jgi:hypothetical protein